MAVNILNIFCQKDPLLFVSGVEATCRSSGGGFKGRSSGVRCLSRDFTLFYKHEGLAN